MTSQVADLVQQSTISTGNGNLTLTPLSGRRTFHDAWPEGVTNDFFYFILHETLNEWEVGTGHMTSQSVMARDTVIASSAAGTKVFFSAGKKNVVNDVPAAYQEKLLNLAPVALSGAYGDLTGRPDLSEVALSGDYDDLNGLPSFAAVATSGAYTDLSGKPTLAPVATSGNYSDLTGKPSPVVLYASSYGVSAANTAAANAVGMLAAIKAARDANATLVMPLGDIKCGQVLGRALSDDATHFAVGNNRIAIDVPHGCRILRQNGVWWLNIDTSDEAVRYPLTSANFVKGTTLGQAGGDASNLYLYTKSLALGVANASAIKKYDRVTIATVPDTGYLVTNDSGDDYGWPVEDLHVLDVNYNTNIVYLSLPVYKGITQYNTRLYHWPNRDAVLKITGAGDFILDPATGDPENDSLTNAREMISCIGLRTEINGSMLHIYDSDRGLLHIQRTIGSALTGVSTRRTRNQSTGASNERKLSYLVDNYANKNLLLADIEAEGTRHIDTGNTSKSTNRFMFGAITATNPVGFYYDATDDSLSNGNEVYIDGVGGMTEVNRIYATIAGATSFSGSVLTITNANPCVVQYSGSDAAMANDRKVKLSGVSGMTQVNGNWYTVKNWNSGAKTFELWNLAGTAAIDATGFGTFVSGTTDKVGFGFAQLGSVNGSSFTPYISGGFAFRVDDWVNNGYVISKTTRDIRGRVGQGNGADSHAAEVDGKVDGYDSQDNVMYYDGLINPKGGNFRGNGDAASNVSLKNIVQAWTFDGMAIDHIGRTSNLYVLTNIDIVDTVWEADQDLFQFAGAALTTTPKKAVITNARIRGAVGRIANVGAYAGEAVFDNLQVQGDLARVATGTGSRYLFTNNGGDSKLVIRNTFLDFSKSNILDSTGAVSTAALKRFGILVGDCTVDLDNVKITGTSKLDPRYGLFTTDGVGAKTVKVKNVTLDDPNFPLCASPATNKTVSSATAANPVVCTTSTAHGYSSNDYVYHDNMDEMIQINQKAYPITVLSATTYSIPVDGSTFTPETTGGICSKITQPTDVTIVKQDSVFSANIGDLANVSEGSATTNGTQYALKYNSTTKEYTLDNVSAAGQDGSTLSAFNLKDSGVTGYTGSDMQMKQAAVATTNNTATVIASIPLAVGESVYVHADILMNRDTAAEGGFWEIAGGFRRAAGGNVTQISTTAALASKEDSSGSPTATFVANTTAQTVDITVTGETSKNLFWLANYRFSKLINAS